MDEKAGILGPYVVNKSKVDSYSYKYYLSNGMILHVCECEGPYIDGGKTWYDLRLSESLKEYDLQAECETQSRLTVSVNADHIIMVSEAES